MLSWLLRVAGAVAKHEADEIRRISEVTPTEAVKKAVSRARHCGNSRFADWISRIECSCAKYAAISVSFVFAGKLWTVLLRYWHACCPKAVFANFSMLCTMQYRFHCVLTLVRPR